MWKNCVQFTSLPSAFAGESMSTSTECEPKRAARWLVVLFFCAVFTPFLAAQNPRGTLRGVVQDASGGRIAGAKIFVTSADSSNQRQIETGDRGEFRVDDLLPGEYRVRVEAANFQVAEAC